MDTTLFQVFFFLFFFLFICLKKEPPSSESRRALVLVTKTLQNLANGLYFGEKEEYMENLNEFIKSKLEVVTSYFEKLAVNLFKKEKVKKFLNKT